MLHSPSGHEAFNSEEVPIWESCLKLTSPAVWHPARRDSKRFSAERTVTWGDYPFRYMLTEFAQENGRIFKRLETKMFQLNRVSAQRIGTGLHDYSRYFIIDAQLTGAIHSQVKLPQDMTESDKKDMVSNFDFTLENGLYAPTAEDEAEVEIVLHRAYMDGVTSYVST